MLVGLVGCGRGDQAEVRPEVAPPPSLVAESKVPSIPVFESPGAPSAKLELSHPNEDGAPRVFLVKAQQSGWLQVLLPVRPNGSRGWVRQNDVTLGRTPFRVRIELGAHRITVWNGDKVVTQEPVGVGRANSPTPGGEYYITELLRPPEPNGLYGPFAFGLSGFSDVHQDFAGGPGFLGLHGTNDPAGLGKDVSAGCIRMGNEGITRLASMLPLGSPVEIVA
ncbi:MAG: L,D-transpeptidase [Actinomycetota bacterium]|nr:L,D-transpeptidase [Actinomycetota bacterium]